MTDEPKPGAYRCATCGESINIRHNNYRVVAIALDPAWTRGEKGAPPPCVYKHKFCMDADEWACEPAEVA